MSVSIHQSVSEASDRYFAELRRKNYTTPTSYLDLIKTYVEMLKFQRGIVPVKIQRYQGGLKRLADTNKMVDEMKAELILLRPKIDEKTEETQKLMIVLDEQKKIADEQAKLTAVEEAAAQKLYNEVMVIKTDCESELAKAMPIYKEALSALDTLNKNDIIEMKSYAKPAEDIVLVISAVCLLLEKPESWDEGKKLMNQPEAFINSLKTFNKDNIKEAKLKKLKKYTQDPRFVPALIEKKSAAGKSICLWARAIDNYSEVLKIIKPKQESLAKAEGELKVADAELSQKKASLRKVQDEVAALDANLDRSKMKLK
jgi:dynein heavy chain, axonemal